MKEFFKSWNLYEKIMLTIGLMITTLLSILTQSNFLAYINGYCNIFDSILSTKGKISYYYFCIVATSIYIYISFNEKYYSEVITSLFIVMPITIYGYFNWKKNTSKDDEVKIKTLSNKEILIPFLVQVVMSVPYYYMLKYFNSDLLITQTINMCLTILAFYYLAKASPLAFIFFILSDIPKIVLWFIPVLQKDFTNIPLLTSNIIYFINDCYGLINWAKIAKKQRNA